MLLFVPEMQLPPKTYIVCSKLDILEQPCCQPLIIKKNGKIVRMSRRRLREIIKNLRKVNDRN